MERLRSKDHGGILLAPSFFGFGHILADRPVADEHPRFVHDEHLELSGVLDRFNRPAGAVEDVEKQWFKHVGIDGSRVEIESLEWSEREGVFGVVEDMTELSGVCPPLQLLAQRANHRSEVGQRACLGVELIHPLDGYIEAAFFNPVQFVLAVALDQNFDERIEEIKVHLLWSKTEGVDGELLMVGTDIQIGTAKDAGDVFKAPAQIKNVGLRVILLKALDQEI